MSIHSPINHITIWDIPSLIKSKNPEQQIRLLRERFFLRYIISASWVTSLINCYGKWCLFVENVWLIGFDTPLWIEYFFDDVYRIKQDRFLFQYICIKTQWKYFLYIENIQKWVLQKTVSQKEFTSLSEAVIYIHTYENSIRVQWAIWTKGKH